MIRPEWKRVKKGDNLISPEEEKHLEDVAEEFKKWRAKEKREQKIKEEEEQQKKEEEQKKKEEKEQERKEEEEQKKKERDIEQMNDSLKVLKTSMFDDDMQAFVYNARFDDDF